MEKTKIEPKGFWGGNKWAEKSIRPAYQEIESPLFSYYNRGRSEQKLRSTLIIKIMKHGLKNSDKNGC